MADQERRHVPLSVLQTTQRDQARRLSEMVYQPQEVTRSDYYLLPSLQEGIPFFNPATTYNIALAHFLNSGQTVRVLDLGCGAGSWVEKQARVEGVDAYGISAKDYRSRVSRPELVYSGHDDHYKMPTYKSPDGYNLYFGEAIVRNVELDDDHYLVGDIHDLLRTLPSNSFHIIVSYQACRYLLDPLRVLKQINRLLVNGGYAFLESFQPVILDKTDLPLSPSNFQRRLRRNGHALNYGEYSPDETHVKFGLALKKTRPRLSPPVGYLGVAKTAVSSAYQTETVTYRWE